MSEDYKSIISSITLSFGTIFISEIGDKSFMLLVSLSQKNSCFQLVLANQIALTPLIIVSAYLGNFLSFLPQFYISVLGSISFLIFSVMCYRECYYEYKKTKKYKDESKLREKYKSLFQQQQWWKLMGSVIGTIICLEIGDPSEFALFSLSLTYDTVCVIIGAFWAHFACSVLAVTIGKILSKYVSEIYTQLTVGTFFLWLTCLWTYYSVEEGLIYFNS